MKRSEGKCSFLCIDLLRHKQH